MNRRRFIGLGAIGTVGMASGVFSGCATAKPEAKVLPNGKKQFTIKFAPRNLFQYAGGKNPLDVIKYIHSEGFIAVEGLVFVRHNKKFTDKDLQMQRDMGALVKELGLFIGPISSMNEKDFPTMTANQVPTKEKVIRDKTALRDVLKAQMDTTFGVLERTGGKTFIIGPGTVDKELSFDAQYANVVENMKFCAEYCAKSGYTLELEPLNTTSHPNLFCDRAELGAKIVNEVNHPNCRLLYDIFHEQMQVGNTDSLDNPNVWKAIESFHVADCPGRLEPGTGKMDYQKIFQKIWDKGFRGIVGLEHGVSKKTAENDRRMVEMYRAFDSSIAKA